MASTTKRRRFQAPITSFFTTQSIPDDTSSDQPCETFSSPPLPNAIQSSLLTVGMRVRKSIPEGYKTHKTLQPASLHQHRDYFLDAGDQGSDSTKHGAPSSAHAGYAELAPFCGLHKVGGMAVQPMPVASNGDNRYIFTPRSGEQVEECDPWSLPSSQESADSNALPAPSNKRTFMLDQDDNGDDEDDFENTLQGQQRSSYPFSHTRMPDLNTLLPPTGAPSLGTDGAGVHRPYAIPRSRFSSKKGRNFALEGQENLGLTWKAHGGAPNTAMALVNDIDFEDADFLRAREDVDMDDDLINNS